MNTRYSRLKMRRGLKRQKKQVTDISQNAEKSIDKYFFKRFENLSGVRRFVVSWVLLLVVLIGAVIVQQRGLSNFYLQAAPVEGGIVSEGVVGEFTNANPLYANTQVDQMVAKLVFSGLLTYNQQNQLISDLADKWEVNDKANQYTVRLRDNAYWHDGKPVTADDVLFTYQTIQNPDSKSALRTSWLGVTLEKLDENTVRFSLPVSLASFPHFLTNGIIPKHILQNVPAAQLRTSKFGTENPIGSGPFSWISVLTSYEKNNQKEQNIQLKKFDKYYKGSPKLDGFSVNTYINDERMLADLRANKLTLIGCNDNCLSEDDSETDLPMPLTSAVMLFLKTTNEGLNDVNFRRALAHATNTGSILANIGYPLHAVDSPLLKRHIGYNSDLTQLDFNPAEAKRLLDAAGWIVDPTTGKRTKNGKELQINLVSQGSVIYTKVADMVQKQWGEVGVPVLVTLQNSDNFEQVVLKDGVFDVLLYGINLGADPDVFAYWHSSQATSGFNLSAYQSGNADRALEAGRSRTEPSLRAAKYKTFLESWRGDVPAIGLYQPQVQFLTNTKVYGLDPRPLNIVADHLNNVHEWMINTDQTVK